MTRWRKVAVFSYTGKFARHNNKHMSEMPQTSDAFVTRPPSKALRRPVQRRVTPRFETQTMPYQWRDAVPNDRFAHLVKDATRSFQRSLQLRLCEHDVPFGHWSFLRVLWEQDGITQKRLSDEVGVMEPTTFAAVKAMEARGWLERRHLADNRKNMYVFLTDAGRALKAKLLPLAEQVNCVGVMGISPEDIATARRVLLAIIAQLKRDSTADENPPDH